MTLALSNTKKFLLLKSGSLFSLTKEKKDKLPILVLISSVRYKQRGQIPNPLVERHRQSPLGKAKAGAAVGVFPPKDEKSENIRTTPHDFK
jgi:hypothetical protein